MKEIGGYFELDEHVNIEFYPNLIPLNSARNALLYACKVRKISKLYVPYFLCDCISDICEKNNVKYEYYHINPDFSPRFCQELNENEYLYIVNYYGQLDNGFLIEQKKKYNNVIVDNVQAFFQEPVAGIDTIYSCRKYFGVPDGAYLAIDKRPLELQEDDVSKDRMKHILGRYEGTASDYYSDFRENENLLYSIPLRYMSKLTHNLLGIIDYKKAIERRNANWELLSENLMKTNPLDVKRPIGPYAYPLLSKNGATVRKKLAMQKIYIPTLWPNVVSEEYALEKDYANNILPIPCDQRYSEIEMKEILSYLKKMLI